MRKNRRWGYLKSEMSKERYKELEYFCLQYNDKKKIKDMNTPSGRKAKMDIYIIESVAATVYPEIKNYIIESVSTGKTWEQLNPPCGRRQFYNARKKFFNVLSENK